jgi:hypothetical protein
VILSQINVVSRSFKVGFILTRVCDVQLQKEDPASQETVVQDEQRDEGLQRDAGDAGVQVNLRGGDIGEMQEAEDDPSGFAADDSVASNLVQNRGMLQLHTLSVASLKASTSALHACSVVACIQYFRCCSR